MKTREKYRQTKKLHKKHYLRKLKQHHLHNKEYKQKLLHYYQKQREQRIESRKTVWGKIKWLFRSIRDIICFGIISGLILGIIVMSAFLLNDINVPEIVICILVLITIMYLWKQLK